MFPSASKQRPVAKTALEKRTAKWWRRCGSKERGFWYETADHRRLQRAAELRRIKSLVIPPAWSDVRISPKPLSRIQVVGRDSQGRLQYLYHPAFVARRERHKFLRIPDLAQHLSKLRRKTAQYLKQPELSKNVVLAAIVRLIDELHFRVGSERSVRAYKTYGITTLRSSHVTIGRDESGTPNSVDFNYVGKHHIRHHKTIRDERLARLVEQLKQLRGSRLFKYVNEAGNVRHIRPRDVNDYIRDLTQRAFTSKDFRTWAATLHAARELAKLGVAHTKTERKRKMLSAIRIVAERLGNTVSVCRSSYIHPAVLRAYELGRTLNDFMKRVRNRRMRTEEAALLRLLRAPLPQPH